MPVTVTVVPPAPGPKVGLTEVIVGAGRYVNWSAATTADVPMPLVTVMFTVPAAPAGETAVMLVGELTT